MTNCLWCDHEIEGNVNWSNLFSGEAEKSICARCSQHLNVLNNETCKKCNRQSEVDTCHDCQQWQLFFNKKDPLTKNASVYEYNAFIKEVISKWKYRGDYLLGEIFRETFRNQFYKQFKNLVKEAMIVPIPLHTDRLLERGFNQAVYLANMLEQDVYSILKRLHSEKQSKKSRLERISSTNPFILSKKTKNPVILVDDIYTTGRTVRHAAKLLKDSGCPEVYSYTLIRG